MVAIDRINVDWIPDAISFAENDVLMIDAVNVNDVKAFCSSVDALESPLL